MSSEGHGRDLSPLLDDLAAMQLRPAEWTAVAEQLHAVDPAAPDVTTRVSQIVFEARVQRRFHGGRAASTLPPTKQTSALPWVGLVCAVAVMAVGGALGGGVVLVGVALFGVFVFGIALAGSRVAHSRVGSGVPADEPAAVSMPDEVNRLVTGLRPH